MKGDAGGGLVLLGIAFVVLKLCHVINWSWWWVTAPFWGLFAAAAVLLTMVGFVTVIGVITIMFMDWVTR